MRSLQTLSLEDVELDDAADAAGDRGVELVGLENRVDLTDEGQQVDQELPGEGRAGLGAGPTGHPAC